MKIIAAILCVILVLFALVQYNDPDALFWAAIYGAGAGWSGIAAFRPAYLRLAGARWLLAATVGLAVIGTWWFWPSAQGWWQREVWWEDEEAREGMGMMVVLASLLYVGLQALRIGRRA